MNLESKYLAAFGLSMTLLMAAVLFVLVGINPKLESYSLLPWVYASLSASGSIGLWLWAKSMEKKLDVQTVKTERTNGRQQSR